MPVKSKHIASQPKGPTGIDLSGFIDEPTKAAPTGIDLTGFLDDQSEKKNSGNPAPTGGTASNPASRSASISASGSSTPAAPATAPIPSNTPGQDYVNQYDPAKQALEFASLDSIERKQVTTVSTDPAIVSQSVKNVLAQRSNAAIQVNNGKQFFDQDLSDNPKALEGMPHIDAFKKQLLEGDGPDSNIRVAKYWNQRKTDIQAQMNQLKEKTSGLVYRINVGDPEQVAKEQTATENKVAELQKYMDAGDKYAVTLSQYNAASKTPPPTDLSPAGMAKYRQNIGLQVQEALDPEAAAAKARNIESGTEKSRHPEIVDLENYHAQVNGIAAEYVRAQADLTNKKIDQETYDGIVTQLQSESQGAMNLHPYAKAVFQRNQLGELIRKNREETTDVAALPGSGIHPVSLFQNLVNYHITDDEIKQAAKDPALGMSEEDIKYQISHKDEIPGTSLMGNMLNTALFQTYNKILTPIGEFATKWGHIRTDAQSEADQYQLDKQFQANSDQQFQNPETIVDTRKNLLQDGKKIQNPDYLQEVANPKVGTYNWGYGLINGIGGGMASLGQMWAITEATGGAGDEAIGEQIGAKLSAISEGKAATMGFNAAQKQMFGNVVGLSMLNMNDGLQLSKKYIGEDKGDQVARDMFAAAYAMIPGLIFGGLGSPVKLLKTAFGVSSPELAEAAAKNFADLIPKNGIQKMEPSAIKEFFKKNIAARILKSGLEENVKASGLMTVNQMANMGLAAVTNPQSVDVHRQGQELVDEGVKNFITFAPISLFGAAKGSIENPYVNASRLEQESIYKMGLDPVSYKDYVDMQVSRGVLTQSDANSRIQLVNEMHDLQASGNVPEQLTTDNKIRFANALLHEQFLNKLLPTIKSKALTEHYQKQIDGLQKVQEDILYRADGIPRDNNGNPIIRPTKTPNNEDQINLDPQTQGAESNNPQSAQGGSNGAPAKDATDSPLNDLLTAKNIILEGKVQGFRKDILEKDAKENNDAVLTDHLKSIAEQAQDPNSRKETVKTYGQDLVDHAEKMFPSPEPAPAPEPKHIANESPKPERTVSQIEVSRNEGLAKAAEDHKVAIEYANAQPHVKPVGSKETIRDKAIADANASFEDAKAKINDQHDKELPAAIEKDRTQALKNLDDELAKNLEAANSEPQVKPVGSKQTLKEKAIESAYADFEDKKNKINKKFDQQLKEVSSPKIDKNENVKNINAPGQNVPNANDQTQGSKEETNADRKRREEALNAQAVKEVVPGAVSGTTSSNVEPEMPQGRTQVTLTGLTEEERQALINERQKETKITDKQREVNNIILLKRNYDAMPKGKGSENKPGKESKEGKALRVHINQLLGRNGLMEFGRNIIRDIKTNAKYTLKYDEVGDRAIVKDGVPLSDRPIELKKAFAILNQYDAFPLGETLGNAKMSVYQMDATINDIENGIPSERAEKYLNTLQEYVDSGHYPLDPEGNNSGSLDDLIGIKKEHREIQGGGVSHEDIMKWLSEDPGNPENHGTPIEVSPEEEQAYYDHLNKLITEYEQHNTSAEIGSQSTIPGPETTSAEAGSKPAEPDKGAANIPPGDPAAADQTANGTNGPTSGTEPGQRSEPQQHTGVANEPAAEPAKEEPKAEPAKEEPKAAEPPPKEPQHDQRNEPTPEGFTRISIAGIAADYNKEFKFPSRTDQDAVDQTVEKLLENAELHGLSKQQIQTRLDYAAAIHVGKLKQQLHDVKHQVSQFDVVTAAIHLNNLQKRYDDLNRAGADPADVERVSKDLEDTLFVIRKMSNTAGRVLRSFDLVFQRAGDAAVRAFALHLKYLSGAKTIPMTMKELAALQQSGAISPEVHNFLSPYVEQIESTNKELKNIKDNIERFKEEDRKKTEEEFIKRQREEEQNSNVTPKEKKERQKKSSSLRDLAQQIRLSSEQDQFLRGAKGPAPEAMGASFSMADFKEAVATVLDHIATGIEKGEQVVDLIKEAVGKAKDGIDKAELKQAVVRMMARANMPEKQASLDKLAQMAKDEGVNHLTPKMAESGLIDAVINDHVHSDLPYDQIFKAATEDIKKILPDTSQKDVHDAVFKKGIFKLETKQDLEDADKTKLKDAKTFTRRVDRLDALEAGRDINDINSDTSKTSAERKQAIEDRKTEFHKQVDARIKEIEDQQKEIKKQILKSQREVNRDLKREQALKDRQDELKDEIKRVLTDRKFVDDALTQNKKQKQAAYNEWMSLKDQLKDAYHRAGLRAESGDKSTIITAQEADAQIAEIQKSVKAGEMDESEAEKDIAGIKAKRDTELNNTRQGVLTALRERLGQYRDAIDEKLKDPKITDAEKENLNNLRENVSNLHARLKPNRENLKDQIDKAHQNLNAIIDEHNGTTSANDVRGIRDEMVANNQKTSDQLQRQAILDKLAQDRREIERKLRGGQYTNIPTKDYSPRYDHEITAEQAKLKTAEQRLNGYRDVANRESRTFGDKALAARRELLISSPNALLKVGLSAVLKPIIDQSEKLVFGHITGALTGIKPTGYERWDTIMGQAWTKESAAKWMDGLNEKYIAALRDYQLTNQNSPNDPAKLKDAAEKLAKAELNYNGSLYHLFVASNSGVDIYDTMVNAASRLDDAIGKYHYSLKAERVAANKDKSAFVQAINESAFVLQGINRTHGAMKSISTRQALVDGYMENLKYFQDRDGGISPETQLEAWTQAVLYDMEPGRFGENTALSEKLNKLKSDKSPYVRYPANYLFPVAKVGINMTKQAIDHALPVEVMGRILIKEAVRGWKLNNEDQVAYNNQLDRYAKAIKRGINELPLEQKKYINTLLIRGLAGAAQYMLMAGLISSGAVRYGGAYNDTDRFGNIYGKVRDSHGKIMKAGEWEFFGKKYKIVDMFMNHSPYFLPSALMADLHNQLIRKSKDESQVSKGVMQMAHEVISRLPFQGPFELAKILQGDQYALEKQIANLVNIPVLTKLAEWTDSGPNGEPRPVSVAGKGFLGVTGNLIQKQLPGFRRNLPTKRSRN